MKNLAIGPCDLRTRKEALEKFIEDVYNRFYKKERLKHITREDKRLPKIKITDDIFSLSIWFKDRSGKESKIVIDGTVFLNDLKINSITTDYEELNEPEYHSHMELLKSLSSCCGGYLLLATDGLPSRLKKGSIDSHQALLKDIYNASRVDAKQETEDIFRWLSDCQSE